MSRPRHAGSIFWGLILIGVGMIFLLKNLGYEIPIWAGIARYWPILLIVWGSIKMVDYARWKKAGQPGPLFGAGEVVLLIIVILSGTALTAANDMGPDFNSLIEIAGIDLLEISGTDYQFMEHHELDVPAGSAIEVINRYGNVVITPADTDRIIVDVTKTIKAANEKQAGELQDVLKYSIVQEGSRYRVVSNYNRDQNRVRGRRFQTSLAVKVPKKSSLSINNRNGSVEVSDLVGDQNIDNGFGLTALRRISGTIQIKSRNDTVIVEDITGNATIDNQFGNVEARRVAGRLDVDHRNGEVDVEGIKGDAKVNSEFGSINATDIQGALTVEARMTSVEALRVENNVTVETQFNYVKLEDVKGAVWVENSHGNVEVRYLQPPRNNVRLSTKFAEVRLVLPASSSFSVDAETRHANISTDFDDLSIREERDRESLNGRVGSGGPEVRIENQNGNIEIIK